MMRNRTYFAKPSEVKQEWHVIDASGQVLGRLASRVATILQGKHKPTYTAHIPTGDYVVVLNASKVRVTGKKLTDKIYYRHSGYIGGLKSDNLRDMLAKHPERVVELAVKGMLPTNKQGRNMLKRLKVYAGGENPHQAQATTPAGKER